MLPVNISRYFTQHSTLFTRQISQLFDPTAILLLFFLYCQLQKASSCYLVLPISAYNDTVYTSIKHQKYKHPM